MNINYERNSLPLQYMYLTHYWYLDPNLQYILHVLSQISCQSVTDKVQGNSM